MRHFLSGIASRCEAGQTVKWDGEHVCFTTITPDAAKEQLEKNDRFLETLNSCCSIHEGLILTGLTKDERSELVSLFGKPAAESIALAAVPGRGLWSDDVTHQARTKFGTRNGRIWSQRVFSWLSEMERLDHDRESILVLSLISLGYTHTYLTPKSFLKAGELAKWNPDTPPLKTSLDWFSNTKMTDQGLIRLVAGTLPKIWRMALLEEQAQAVTIRLLDRLKHRRNGGLFISGIEVAADLIFNLDLVNAQKVKKIIEVWRQTNPEGPHFIV
jgi:hypothetical protein